MELADRIDEDLKTAMKSGDKVTVNVLRMLKSDLKYKHIELGCDLTEDDGLAVLSSAVKKRLDALESFEKGGRDDLVAKEKAEWEVLKRYLPEQLSDAELEEIVTEVIAETDASTPADFGLVMKNIMPRVKGRVDGRKVNEFVRNKLSG